MLGNCRSSFVKDESEGFAIKFSKLRNFWESHECDTVEIYQNLVF